MKFYIQDNWLYEEGSIVKDICELRNIPYEILTKEEILLLKYNKENPIIADRDIISILKNDSIDTYDSIFKGLYGTEKLKTTISYLKDINNKIKFPIFMKPVNTKIFDGLIINEYKELLNFNDNIEVFISDIMELKCESRILITTCKKVYGNITEDFKKIILDRIKDNKAYAIDIALFNNKWIIVENNPTYSLGINDLDDDDYFDFIINSW